MGEIIALDGNAAIAQGVMRSKVQLVAAYPITPQTPVVENISKLIANEEFNASYINVESEHSALSAVVGAASAGVRAFTASASHGLALMHELTGLAASSRLPIVMGVVSRAIPGPLSLWCDHSDIMTQRDQGWIQLFAKDPQEALDFIMIAYRIAEDKRVLTPVMVEIDGFFVSHATEAVNVPSEEEASEFIGEFKPSNFTLDPENPYAINNLTSPEIFTEIKYDQKEGMDASKIVMDEVFEEFGEKFGRKYAKLEENNLEDADTVIVCMGSSSGTANHVSNKLREEGKKVGVLRVVSFRPFPYEEVLESLKGIKNIAVMDRVSGIGSKGPLYEEIVTTLRDSDEERNIYNFVAGLGGRDISEKTIRDIYSKTDELSKDNAKVSEPIWIDLKKEGE